MIFEGISGCNPKEIFNESFEIKGVLPEEMLEFEDVFNINHKRSISEIDERFTR